MPLIKWWTVQDATVVFHTAVKQEKVPQTAPPQFQAGSLATCQHPAPAAAGPAGRAVACACSPVTCVYALAHVQIDLPQH